MRPGTRSCCHASVTDPVTSSQALKGKSAAVTLPTSTLSPLSSSAPSWSVLKKIPKCEAAVAVTSHIYCQMLAHIKRQILWILCSGSSLS